MQLDSLHKILILSPAYSTVSILKGALNDTNHCVVIIYQRLSRILNMTIHNKMYKVILQYHTIGRDTAYHFIPWGIHPK